MSREEYPITVNISNRHVHLSERDIQALFGRGYKLSKLRDLMQPGEYACKESVRLVGPKGTLEHVRVLGPPREKTQVEISRTDAYLLGVNPPLRSSGDLNDSSPIRIEGLQGNVELNSGLILALRHIHMTPYDADILNVTDKDLVSIKCEGERAGRLDNVLVRVKKNSTLECHLDTDEGNALGVKNGDKVYIIQSAK